MMNKLILLTTLLCCTLAMADDDLRLWYEKPASPKWEQQEALPIGNGYMGAEIFGGVVDERIQFNECTLWTGKPHDYVREGAGDVLDEIRKLVFEKKEKEVTPIVREKFLSDPVRQKAYQPFGDLHLHFTGHENATDYRRELDLNSAIARVTYRVGEVKYTREVFASYPDHVIVVHISASAPGKLSFTVKMDSPHQESHVGTIAPDTLVLSGQVRDYVEPKELGVRFESRLRAIAGGGNISISDDTVSIDGADQATLILAAATSFVNFQDVSADPAARCEAVLSKIHDKSYDKLLAD